MSNPSSNNPTPVAPQLAPGVNWGVFPRTSYPDDADMVCDHLGVESSGRCNKCGRNVLKP